MFRRAFYLSLILLLRVFSLTAQQALTPEITTNDLQTDISYLASDELKGRYTGSEGGIAASNFIRDQFQKAGLTLLGDNGFQNFEVVVSVSAGENNSLRINGGQPVAKDLFTPFPFTQNSELNAGVVFVGYGFDINQDSLKWQDYEGVDVTGKWVLVLRGDPEMDKQESRFEEFGDDRDKVIEARDHGAAGVILVSGVGFDKDDDLVRMIYDKTQSNTGIPVIQVKRAVADQILAPDNLTVEGVEKNIKTGMKPESMVLKAKVDARAEVVHQKVNARNVIGMLEGSDPVLKDSYIVIGAHYDHLGMGGPGSGSRFMDSLAVHNGADDNASGTAGVLEVAAKLASMKGSLGRSIIFVAFDGEELGILGSGYFVDHPPVKLTSIMAMVNFDMIGRLKDDSPAIMIGGMGTAKESAGILDSLNNLGIQLNYSPEGFGPSDHASFYAENIPVYFITTGAHEDYHTPDDDWQKINYKGEVKILDIAVELVLELANRPTALTFQEAGPKEQSSGRAGYRFKVTLGIMPDFTTTVESGLPVGGVKKDGPAYKGGMLKGDVIVAMDGKPVNDIYDYMNRLKKLQKGQTISVDVLRNGQIVVLIIQL
jgi:aminopeptidase YwaD